jgi:hypothetical protein
MGTSSPTAGVPWLEGWKFRRKMVVTSSTSTLTNFQLKASINTLALISVGKMSSDCKDMRFTTTDGLTTINNYWIEKNKNTTDTLVWLKIPTLPNGTTAFYMYYGNSSAAAVSDFDNVFTLNAENDHVNPNLESDTAGWNLGTFVRQSDVGGAYTGSYGLKTTVAGTAYTQSGWAQFNTLTTGKLACSYGWVKSNTSNVARIVIAVGGQSNETESSDYHNGDNTWQKILVTQKVNVPAQSSPWTSINAGNSGTVYGDTFYIGVLSNRVVISTSAGSEPLVSFENEEGLFFSTGTYKSSVIDAASKIVVSSISWNPSSQPTETNLAVSVRVSSYPFSVDSSTPAWLTVSNGQTLNWHGRYIQYQSTFTTTNSTTTPRLEDISIAYRVKPWQEKSVTRTPPYSFGFGGGENWTWQVPVKGGTLVTISAYIRYNAEYQGGIYDKPKLTLSGLGINESISATSSAENSWELRQLSGTPSADGILTLKAEGFSVAPAAKFYIDDILVNQ